VLLTTPESLEAMLVSTNVDHRAFFSGLQALVVDEVHAFAGDDRGWHLLAVLERLQRIVGRPVQRIGLSATVGNPEQLLTWLQGSGSGHRPGAGRSPAPAREIPCAATTRRHPGRLCGLPGERGHCDRSPVTWASITRGQQADNVGQPQ
jgi:ATP-dependent Lhr-like helicase